MHGHEASARVRSPVARAVHWLYKRTFGFLTVGACRFHPTCSDYSLEAIEVHGWCRGCVLAIKRLLRCHPWNRGGVDPVP